MSSKLHDQSLVTLEVENFQSHGRSSLELSPGVNVITGTSDSGKTSLLRSLIWLIKNRPQGFSFKSTFAKNRDHTRVQVKFADGTWVTRERGPSTNKYFFSGGTPLEALRSDVPEEISKILRVEDYNIQTQFDTYFLLQNTPGEVGRILNEVVGLDVIDVTLSKINSIISTAKQNVNRYQVEIDEIKGSLNKFQFIDKAQEEMDKIESLIQDRSKILLREYHLQRLLAEIEESDVAVKKLERDLKIESDIEDLEDFINTHSSGPIEDKILRMENVLTEEVACKRLIASLSEDVGDLENQQNKLLRQIDQCPACGMLVDDEGREQLVRFFGREG